MSDSDKAESKNESATADGKPVAEDAAAKQTDAQSIPAKDAPKDNAAKPTQAPSRSAPRIWPGLFILTLIASALGAGFAAYYWTSPAGNARLSQLEARVAGLEANSGTQDNLRGDLNALDAQISQIETRVRNLENVPQASTSIPAEPGTIDPRLVQLAERLNAIENVVPADLMARLDNFAPRDAQAALAARVTSLEQSDNGDALLRAGRILALSDLSRSASGSEPFHIALDAAAAMLPGDTAIDPLRPYAAQGAPTLAGLAARFPEAARQALAREGTSQAENILARMWNNIAGMISIRRVGNVEGNDSSARLARAEAAINSGNLTAAVAEVSRLEGAASESMLPWLDDARARLAVETAIDGINAHIVQLLAGQNPVGESATGQIAPIGAP